MTRLEPAEDRETADRRKLLAGAVAASQFINELLDAYESLNEVADRHGSRTLADLLYLHHAILTDGYIQWFRDDSRIDEVVQGLPSAERWKAHVDKDVRPVQADEATPQQPRRVSP